MFKNLLTNKKTAAGTGRSMSSKIKFVRNLVILAISCFLIQLLNTLNIIDSYYMQLLMIAGINIMMTVSLNLVNGFTGQFSIGHAGFMAIGAYISAGLTTLVLPQTSVPSLQIVYFIFSMLLGGIGAGVIGFLIGLPCLKLKGDYLAIVTLAFGEILRAIIRQLMFVGGPRGLTGIPSYSNFTIIFILMVISIVVVRNIVNSSYGRAFISIRENEIASETMGINTYKFKMLSFVIAAVIAGVAGGLYAHLLRFIQPDQYSLTKSCDYLVFLYAGGMGSISGSILGASLLTILPELLRFLSNWRIVIYAVLLIFIMLRRQNGLYGNKEFPVLKVKNY